MRESKQTGLSGMSDNSRPRHDPLAARDLYRALDRVGLVPDNVRKLRNQPRDEVTGPGLASQFIGPGLATQFVGPGVATQAPQTRYPVQDCPDTFGPMSLVICRIGGITLPPRQ